MCRGRRRESRDTRPRESRGFLQESRTRRFGGRAAGGSHRSARGAPGISVFKPTFTRFRVISGPRSPFLTVLGNLKRVRRRYRGSKARLIPLSQVLPTLSI